MIRIHGLKELQAQLKALGDVELAGKVLAKAAREAFKPVLEAAKAAAPKDTGELADSLLLATRRRPDGSVVVGIKIGRGKGARQASIAAAAFGEGQSTSLPPARRWHFIELGTSKQPAHPFLRPALDTNSAAVFEGLKANLRKGIERALKKRSK